MLRWMCCDTWRLVGVAPIVEKMVETRFRWFGQVEPVDFVVKRVDVVRSLEAKEDLGKNYKRNY